MFAPISKLIMAENELVIKNDKIAVILLAKFFPLLPKYPRLMVESNSNQFSTLLITEVEIQDIIFQANSLKKTEDDRISALIWQKTWLVLKDFVMPLFQNLLQKRKLLDGWKVAKILLLRKLNKRNYQLLGTYCLISLLPTLSKVLEYLIT